MPLSTIKWTKPVSSKLQKKSIRRSITNSQSHGRDRVSTASQPDENHGSHDRWSWVSILDSRSIAPVEDSVDVNGGVGIAPSVYHATSSRVPPASDSPPWSSIDAEPDNTDVSPELEYDDCLVHPHLIAEAQEQSAIDHGDDQTAPYVKVYPFDVDYQDEANQNVASKEHDELPDHLVDYRGARSYWNKPLDLKELSEQVEQLKLDYRDLRRTSRELYRKQKNHLHHLQNARWEVEASRDEVEKHFDELKTERKDMPDLEVTDPALGDGEREKTNGFDNDHETRAMLPNSNVRDFAIVNNVGEAAQRNRFPSLRRSPRHLRIEHLKINSRRDFPYKAGTFIPREVEAIYNQDSLRIGWNHKHMPSYKRKQAPCTPTNKSELLIEIGKLPVSERMAALFSAEKFPQAVSTTDRKRETRWYSARTMAELLNAQMMMIWSEGRHDSVTQQYEGFHF